MTAGELIGEIAAGCSFMALIWLMLVFGSAVIPYQPGMHSEEVYKEACGE